MQRKYLSVLIVGRIYQQAQTLKITKVVINTFCAQTQTMIYLTDQNVYNKVSQAYPKTGLKIFKRQEHVQLIDYVVTIGGDGTILYAAKEFKNLSPPFLTFQKGTLGFLCRFSVEHLEQVIKNAVYTKRQNNGDPKKYFYQSDLMRLTSVIKRSTPIQSQTELQKKVVLNEVAITRKNSNRIALQIYVNKQFLTTTTGDGLLISTPTGSTAYALSAGGPVVQNGVNSIMLVPIAPNSLSFRPICLPSNCRVMVKVSKKSREECLVSFDGQSNYQMKIDDEIQIWHESSSNLIIYQFNASELSKNSHMLPTWTSRLKLFLGWNQTFKSQVCQNPHRFKQMRRQYTQYGSDNSPKRKEQIDSKNQIENGRANGVINKNKSENNIIIQNKTENNGIIINGR